VSVAFAALRAGALRPQFTVFKTPFEIVLNSELKKFDRRFRGSSAPFGEAPELYLG
jgi:hypothetical protein